MNVATSKSFLGTSLTDTEWPITSEIIITAMAPVAAVTTVWCTYCLLCVRHICANEMLQSCARYGCEPLGPLFGIHVVRCCHPVTDLCPEWKGMWKRLGYLLAQFLEQRWCRWSIGLRYPRRKLRTQYVTIFMYNVGEQYRTNILWQNIYASWNLYLRKQQFGVRRSNRHILRYSIKKTTKLYWHFFIVAYILSNNLNPPF